MIDNRVWAASNLAARLLAMPWTLHDIASGIEAVIGPVHPRTRAALTVRVFELGEDTYPPAPHRLAACLVGSALFRPSPRREVPAVLDPPRFAPLPPFAKLAIPALATLGDLAAWLALSPEQLDWFSDERHGHRGAQAPALQHYRYAISRKSNGAYRLIEAPKPRLKAIHRQILRGILSMVPVHRCAYGFVAGRSCLGGAQIHASEAIVATFDLARFFPSIGSPRVHGIFRSLGYPWAVARRLAGLCTTVTPAAVFRNFPEIRHDDGGLRALHDMPHLPQGAPTSPALANLLAWTLDRRLHGLARAAGANYTRYADDLAFSGDDAFARTIGRFAKAVRTIVAEEGFSLNVAKTRIMQRSVRQRVTGIVVNDRCNIDRAGFDRLKAILHNCARHGPAGQNRAQLQDFRRHLDGRVVWVETVNPLRGAKLRQLFDRIDWVSDTSTA